MRHLRKTLWLLLPILFAAVLIGLISISEFKDAAIVTRVRIETLILLLWSTIALVWGGAKLSKKIALRKINTALRLQQAEHGKEHQRFIQRLDHELKNPLTAIQLGLENLQQQNPESTGRVEELKVLTRRLTQLTTDLRKLASFEEQKLELENVNIAKLLAETKELADELNTHRNIQLILPAAPWPVPSIHADRDLLQLAIYNLLENAIKYSNGGDHIEIRASDENKTVKIQIADTGLGIPNKELHSVWEELFRASNARDRKGTGIGLPLVKRIIERHNGVISIDSIEGKGTRITIELPIYN